MLLNFTHKQWSPQRNVTTWASEVGLSSIQELFMDSSALWYGLGSPAPITYTHFPRTYTQNCPFHGVSFNRYMLCAGINKETAKKSFTCWGSSGIKGFTMSLQSGAAASARELRARRNTTTGSAMVPTAGWRMRRTRRRKQLQRMSLKLCQKKKRLPNAGSFSPPGCPTPKKGAVQVLMCGRSGFLHALKHQWRLFNDHPDFFSPALNNRLYCSVLLLSLDEPGQGATIWAENIGEQKKRAEEGFSSAESGLFSLWVWVDSLLRVFKSLTSAPPRLPSIDSEVAR